MGVVAAGTLPLNKRERAEQEAANVSDDGSAARRDTILRKEEKKFREESVDLLGGSEVRKIAGERGAEVGFFAEFGAEKGVAEAEAGGCVNDSEATTLASGGAMLATSGVIDGARFNGNFGHDFPRRVECGGCTPSIDL